MNPNHEPWTEWEEGLLRQMYPLREWTVKQIAEKLERTPATIHMRASYCGLKRPTKLDYEWIAQLKAAGENNHQISKATGYSYRGVSSALKAMAEGAV